MAVSQGNLVVKSEDELTREDIERDIRIEAESKQEFTPIGELASYITTKWEHARDAKDNIKERLLTCLRQRKGEYDPDILSEISKIGGSDVYMHMTGVKCRAAESWIRDIMLPAGDKVFSIEATPIPELPPSVAMMIQNKVQQEIMMFMQQTGATPSPDVITEAKKQYEREYKRKIEEEGKFRADRMSQKIEDQLVEGDWTSAFLELISDIVTFPCGFLKGPVVRKRRHLKWQQQAQGGISPIPSDTIVQEFDRVSPFDIYPSSHSRTINDGYLIQRHRLTQRDLEDMIGIPGYDTKTVQLVLEEYGRGGLRDWMWVDEQTRSDAEDRPHEQMAPAETIDAIEFWGDVQGSYLIEWGLEEDDMMGRIDHTKPYPVTAWLVGNYVIKAMINPDPFGNKPFYKASFENVPGSFWGKSVPEMMADLQAIVNASARSLVNNMALASGPQAILDIKRLVIEEHTDDIYPHKLWYATDTQGMQRPPIDFFQPSSNAQELMTVMQYFQKLADDYTGIPPYTYGSPYVGGAGKTASGLSMLMNAANKGMRSVITNIDLGIIEPAIKALWILNMIYDPDNNLKGDIRVKARGVSALMIKEQQQMQLGQLLTQLNNPTDMQIIGPLGRTELLRKAIQPFDIDPDRVVPTNEQIQAKMQAIAQQEQAAAQNQNQPPQNAPAQGPRGPAQGPQRR